MAALRVSIHFLIFHVLTQCFFSTTALVTLTTNPNFDPRIAILGDATMSDYGSPVRLTGPHVSSSGLLWFMDPIKFLGSKPSEKASFSTEFEFSLTGNGSGLSLFMGPYNFASEFLGRSPFEVLNEEGYLDIEFGALIGESNTNARVISVSVNDGPSTHLVIESGERVKSWIDYDATSKRLEVRISKLVDGRPYNPIIAYSIDLSKMWEDDEVYVALGSRNRGNSSGTCYVFSWRFRLRKFPSWMHSLPVDPHGSADNGNENLRVRTRRFCPSTILAGLIFVTVCGALLAFVVLFVWAIFVNRPTVFSIEGNLQPGDVRYEKISVVAEKDEEMVKN